MERFFKVIYRFCRNPSYEATRDAGFARGAGVSPAIFQISTRFKIAGGTPAPQRMVTTAV
jgi:hypothetical protein